MAMTKRIDRRLASEAGWFEVALCASFGSLTGEMEFPHGFVLWCKNDEYIQKGRCTVGAGFYPAEKEKMVKAVLGIKGALDDADRWNRVDLAILIRVNSDIFENTESYREAKAADNGLIYQLFQSDCIDFVVDVAKLVPQLKLPADAGDIIFPSDLIQKISDLNN